MSIRPTVQTTSSPTLLSSKQKVRSLRKDGSHQQVFHAATALKRASGQTERIKEKAHDLVKAAKGQSKFAKGLAIVCTDEILDTNSGNESLALTGVIAAAIESHLNGTDSFFRFQPVNSFEELCERLEHLVKSHLQELELTVSEADISEAFNRVKYISNIAENYLAAATVQPNVSHVSQDIEFQSFDNLIELGLRSQEYEEKLAEQYRVRKEIKTIRQFLDSEKANSAEELQKFASEMSINLPDEGGAEAFKESVDTHLVDLIVTSSREEAGSLEDQTPSGLQIEAHQLITEISKYLSKHCVKGNLYLKQNFEKTIHLLAENSVTIPEFLARIYKLSHQAELQGRFNSQRFKDNFAGIGFDDKGQLIKFPGNSPQIKVSSSHTQVIRALKYDEIIDAEKKKLDGLKTLERLQRKSLEEIKTQIGGTNNQGTSIEVPSKLTSMSSLEKKTKQLQESGQQVVQNLRSTRRQIRESEAFILSLAERASKNSGKNYMEALEKQLLPEAADSQDSNAESQPLDLNTIKVSYERYTRTYRDLLKQKYIKSLTLSTRMEYKRNQAEVQLSELGWIEAKTGNDLWEDLQQFENDVWSKFDSKLRNTLTTIHKLKKAIRQTTTDIRKTKKALEVSQSLEDSISKLESQVADLSQPFDWGEDDGRLFASTQESEVTDSTEDASEPETEGNITSSTGESFDIDGDSELPS